MSKLLVLVLILMSANLTAQVDSLVRPAYAPNAIGYYQDGLREGPWIRQDEYGRSQYREHYTHGKLVERVALRRQQTAASHYIPFVIMDTAEYAADVLLARALTQVVRYPALARETGLSGEASVVIECDTEGRAVLFVGPASHELFAGAVQEAIPLLTPALKQSGLLLRLCAGDVDTVSMQFRLD